MKWQSFLDSARSDMDSQYLVGAHKGDAVGRYILRLRLIFLTPIILTLSLAVVIIISIIYFHEHQSLEGDVLQLRSTVSSLYQHSIQDKSIALQSVLDVLQRDRELVSALKNKDRILLLQRSSSIYEDIHRHYGITHFYFTTPERINLLRVHKPDKFGDVINRETTLSAQHTGANSYGIELGPLGTLTLRYVQPWYDEVSKKIIGFVELGMEVDQTVESMRELFGLDIFVLIKKEYLEKNGWEDGMRTFGKMPEWERYPSVVISMHGQQTIPENISSIIREMDFSINADVLNIELDGRNQHAIFYPLEDVSTRSVGMLVMLLDSAGLRDSAQHTIFIGSTALIVSAMIMMTFFYWLVGRIGERMACNELQLHKMATHDGLTGLFNYRQFERMLQDLVAIQKRYIRPVSLLMIDIDYFKSVNDKYGHLVGDKVLKEVARCLQSQAREMDRVCRYGGEEFAVLLPETDSLSAACFAERLCDVVEHTVFDIDDTVSVSVTISIGLASCPEHAETAQELISASDKALYLAKQTGRNRVCNYNNIPKQSKTLAS